MSQRRSYPNSGDFNLDDLFRPEPGQQPVQQPGQQPGQQPVQQPGPPHGRPPAAPYPGGQAGPYPGQAPGQPEYFGDSALPTQAMPAQQQGMPAPGWAGAAHPGHPADPGQATQYLPPYPAADPQGAGGYPPARRGGGRSSNKLVIGGVVVGGIAAAALVAVLMSSGDDKPGSKPQAAPATTGGTTAATTAQQAPGPTTASVNPEVKAQAQALSDLLGTANDSRQAVIGAVASVQKCEKLPESQQALTAAAGQRRELQSKLSGLKTDKLAGGPQLVEQLNAAWAASATADDEYAAWAGDAQSGCDPKKNDNQHYKNAVAASGTATTAKKQASGLWNTVAGQTALPTRTDGDL
ncbi:hypothetical protein [Kitasatospora purpeofusca]|uniref:hypothetical protein n=1 Tax=Kitasatospora purpeofusca TaxID=67352 RepID=UPI002A5AB3DB|nr:hypothetical protein [Kitasatospora purpeofusca]MDY0809825.1 hypothetical protein [Kitasatospora purpeofusca]